MAAKLARLVYRMLRFGMDQGAELYEAKIHHSADPSSAMASREARFPAQ
jgi:hypothetical protein